MKKIKKPLAIISGATGCIGSSITKKLIEDNYFVIGIGRKNCESSQNEKEKNNFKFYNTDIRSYKEVHSLFQEQFIKNNPPKLIVCCAGILEIGHIDDFAIKDWDRIIQTNLSGTFYLIKESARIMRSNLGGTIIAIGSRWGINGAKRAAAYSASKSALSGLIKSLQLEHLNTNLRFILVSPGSVDSKMSNKVNSQINKKLLKAEDVANFVSYLADTPEYVTFNEICIQALPYDFIH